MFSCESNTDEINCHVKKKKGGFWVYVHHLNQEATELKTTSLLTVVAAMMADNLMGYVVRSLNLLRWTRRVIKCTSDTAKERNDADYLEILGKGWDVAVVFLAIFSCRHWQNMKPLLLCKNPTWARIQEGKAQDGERARGKTGSVVCVWWRVCVCWSPLRAGVCWCLVESRRGRSRSPQARTATKARRCSFCLSPCISASCLNDGGMMPSMSSFLQGVDLPAEAGGGGLHSSRAAGVWHVYGRCLITLFCQVLMWLILV